MTDEPRPRFSPVTAGLLAGFGVLVISQIYSISSIHSLDAKLADFGGELVKAREAFNSEVGKLSDASSTAESARAKTLEELRAELEKARSQAAKGGASSRAGEEALRRLQDINSRMAQSEQKLRETQTQVATEISGVREAANSANTNLAAVTTEVREVK